jgi:hypothetical protein
MRAPYEGNPIQIPFFLRLRDYMDILVTNQLSLRYCFPTMEGGGKSFACVDGCVAIVSVKSTLSAGTLRDALANIASIPDKVPINSLLHSPDLNVPIEYYLDWPYKIVFAFKGWGSLASLLKNIAKFYSENPDIPVYRRPNLIYVASKYTVYRMGARGAVTPDGTRIEPYCYYGINEHPDAIAWLYANASIQEVAAIATHLYPDYSVLANNTIYSVAAYGGTPGQGKGRQQPIERR